MSLTKLLAGAVIGAASLSAFAGTCATTNIANPAPQTVLQRQNQVVAQRRTDVDSYAAALTQFKAAIDRPPGAVGINLNAAESRRRDAVLTGLVLACINAVDAYNLAAQGYSATQVRSAGLPERFVWATDCAPG